MFLSLAKHIFLPPTISNHSLLQDAQWLFRCHHLNSLSQYALRYDKMDIKQLNHQAFEHELRHRNAIFHDTLQDALDQLHYIFHKRDLLFDTHRFAVYPILPGLYGFGHWKTSKFLVQVQSQVFFILSLNRLPNGLRYLRWGGDGEAVQPEKC